MSSTTITPREARERANIYRFLAEVFTAHPTEEAARGLCQMATVLGIPCSGDFSLSELDREFMELFVIPNPRYVAPYESVFRDRWLVPATGMAESDPRTTSRMIKGLVMGESTLAVRRCYLEAGLLPEDDLPDHIANELRFLAYLWMREAGAPADEARRLAEVRAKFREQHLLKWIGQLRERVLESDRLGYYPAALQITEAVLQADT